MKTDDYRLHNVSGFPLVHIQGSRLEAGYVTQWVAEMEMLLEQSAPFVLLLLDSAEHRGHEDQKTQIQWLKTNKRRLSQRCRGIVAVERDSTQRVLKGRQAIAMGTAFGMHFSIAADRHDAKARGLRLLA